MTHHDNRGGRALLKCPNLRVSSLGGCDLRCPLNPAAPPPAPHLHPHTHRATVYSGVKSPGLRSLHALSAQMSAPVTDNLTSRSLTTVSHPPGPPEASTDKHT